MNIGIITLSGSTNYGCLLQTRAVIKTYEELGHKAVLIPESASRSVRAIYQKQSILTKLSPSYMATVLKVRISNKYMLKNQRDKLLSAIVNNKKNAPLFAKAKKLRRESFNRFYDTYIPKTNFSISRDTLQEDKLSTFDFFSVGSDQVWNPTYPHTSELKFLTFAQNKQKLCFAPSFGISHLPEYVKEPYSKWLSEFPQLSVREERGAEIIKELTGKDACVICDPTLVRPREEWEAIEKKPDFSTDKPYALTYFLGNETDEYRKYIEKIAKERELIVINLFDIREPEYFSIDPSEFIYLVHHADAVFTDSFHCAVFSIIFKKDFVVFDRVEDGRSMGSRLKTLLGTFSLSDRMYNIISKQRFNKADFSHTDSVLKTEREKVLDFLQKSIENNLKN